ncbi:phosphotransferase [Chloroflexi bacterium TSY]|nr:phosphotransferase [Chloroflexi bacterium TSY]
METDLTTVLTTQYDAGFINLQALAKGPKHVYHVQREAGPDWVLRAFPLQPNKYLARRADELAQMLVFLEEHEYPTEWVIRTRDRQSVATIKGWDVLVTTYVGQALRSWSPELGTFETDAVMLTPAIWSKLGASLAQLHNVPVDSPSSLPKAGMLPARELTWVGQYIGEVADQVPPHWQIWYDELVAAVRDCYHCEDLTPVLIHCDPNLGNAVVTENGELAFIDWDVVGLGPAVFDLGSLLSNCLTAELTPDMAAIHAVMNGYRQHRTLSPLELDRLADTVPSQTLVTLGGYFPSIIKGELQDDELIYGLTYSQWQAKYRAAAEIAAIARARLTQGI